MGDASFAGTDVEHLEGRLDEIQFCFGCHEVLARSNRGALDLLEAGAQILLFFCQRLSARFPFVTTRLRVLGARSHALGIGLGLGYDSFPLTEFRCDLFVPSFPCFGIGPKFRNAVLEIPHLVGHPPRLVGQPLKLSGSGKAHTRKGSSDRRIHAVAILCLCLGCVRYLNRAYPCLRYHWPVAKRASPVHGLNVVLQQLRLQHADKKSPSEVTQAEIELLLARIASLTETLGDSTQSAETFRVAARLLLADVAMVTAHFRSDSNALSERVTRALEDAQLALEHAADAPAPER